MGKYLFCDMDAKKTIKEVSRLAPRKYLTKGDRCYSLGTIEKVLTENKGKRIAVWLTDEKIWMIPCIKHQTLFTMEYAKQIGLI